MYDVKMLIDFIQENQNEWETKLSSKPYSLKIKKDESGLCLFMYDQINSKMNLPITQVSRGIILDINDLNNIKVVCYPFSKFFNHNESNAHSIDWNTAKVFEKVDGSIMKRWFNKITNQWQWSTNGTIDAMTTPLPTDIGEYKTFGELAESVLKRYDYGTGTWDSSKTYIFELTSPYNRVVVPHSKIELTLLSVRSNTTGMEEDITTFTDLPSLPRVQTYSFKSLKEVIAVAEKLPFSEEGYVVCDGYFNRVKIKSLMYLNCHRLKGEDFTLKRSFEIAQIGEYEEFISYFPEYKDIVLSSVSLLDSIKEFLINKSEELKTKDFPTRKDYAMEVKDLPFNDYFFDLLKGENAIKLDKYTKEIKFSKVAIYQNNAINFIKSLDKFDKE